jgi:hypothetical protein
MGLFGWQARSHRVNKSVRRWLLKSGAILVLLLVFAAYLNPHMAVDLANRVWACF